MKHLDVNGESRKEFARLLEDKQHLQEQVEVGCRFIKCIVFILFLDQLLKSGWCSIQTLGVGTEEYGAEAE